VSTDVNDTIDTTIVTLEATASVDVSGLITYTASVDNAPVTSNLVLAITDEYGAHLGDITILIGETSGALVDVVAPATADTSYDVTVTGAIGGAYENLNTTDGASTIVSDIPASAALLITNSNVDTEQHVEIVIASEHGSNTTGVFEPTDVQGQETSTLKFNDPVVFAEGETYTVTIEHVDGDPIILTDLSITDDDGHVFDIYEGNAKIETGDTGSNTNPDGYIFNLTINEFDHTIYEVSEAIGYEVDANQVLSLDTETNASDFILDFSELSLNGGQDLFGDVQTIDISGKGTGEDNTIYISAQDVLDLGDGIDTTMTITGDAGDEVNLVDLDGDGTGGTWSTALDNLDGTSDYTYSGGSTVDVTVTIDNILNIDTNTSTFDGI